MKTSNKIYFSVCAAIVALAGVLVILDTVFSVHAPASMKVVFKVLFGY